MSLKIVVSLPPDSQPIELDGNGYAKNLKLITTITNTGDRELKLVEDPSNVLCNDPQFQHFIVNSTSDARKNPKFKGLQIAFSPVIAVEQRHIAALGPSATIQSTHDLSRAYKFISGEGEYSFEPKHIFYAVGSKTKEVEIIEAKVESKSLVIHGSSAPVHPAGTSVVEAPRSIATSQSYEEISVSVPLNETSVSVTVVPSSSAPSISRMVSSSVHGEYVPAAATQNSVGNSAGHSGGALDHAVEENAPNDSVGNSAGHSGGALDHAVEENTPNESEAIGDPPVENATKEAGAPVGVGDQDSGSETPTVVKEPEFLGITDFQKQIDLICVTQRVEECINEAISYLEKMPPGCGTLRYEMWFGKYDEKRKAFVQTCFKAIRDGISSFSYDVGQDYNDTVYAYLDHKDFELRSLYLCTYFWNLPLTGSESKIDVVISVLSYFGNDSMLADAWGVGPAKELAAYSPDRAIFNADSYAFFALNRPWYG